MSLEPNSWARLLCSGLVCAWMTCREEVVLASWREGVEGTEDCIYFESLWHLTPEVWGILLLWGKYSDSWILSYVSIPHWESLLLPGVVVERPHSLPVLQQYMTPCPVSSSSPYTLDVLNSIPVTSDTNFSSLLHLLLKNIKISSTLLPASTSQFYQELYLTSTSLLLHILTTHTKAYIIAFYFPTILITFQVDFSRCSVTCVTITSLVSPINFPIFFLLLNWISLPAPSDTSWH